MISVKEAMGIMFETDEENRNAMIDRLSEEDAKYLLKQCLTVMREKNANEEEVNQ